MIIAVVKWQFSDLCLRSGNGAIEGTGSAKENDDNDGDTRQIRLCSTDGIER